MHKAECYKPNQSTHMNAEALKLNWRLKCRVCNQDFEENYLMLRRVEVSVDLKN